jgi:hypothetical protein
MSCSRRTGYRFLTVAALLPALLEAAPKLVRVYPLGGQQGTTVALEILGEQLARATSVEFDTPDLKWERMDKAAAEQVNGSLSIAKTASLGPHILRVATAEGYSTSLLFNVSQIPSILEAEPNDRQPQRIAALPVEIQGRLDGSADIDQFAISVRAGERWGFDFRSIEYGSSVEAKMYLLDAKGNRVAFNDDKSDIDETPFIGHTFARDGTYVVKVDQYRGPRGFNFGKNCSYILRISKLPRVQYIRPLGSARGVTARVRVSGSGLDSVDRVYLTEARRGEYFRMTYPFTMPVHFRADPPSPKRIEGKVLRSRPGLLEAQFRIPRVAPQGLWRLWTSGPHGADDAATFEIGGGYVIDSALEEKGAAGEHVVAGRAGQTLHIWTLAAQLGVPRLDTVLQVVDPQTGKVLGENDDVVAGQGTLLGNPDSSVYVTPASDGPLRVRVFDRLGRSGPDLVYRLKIAQEKPGFQLVTTPENFAVPRGGEGEIKVHLIREAGFQGEVEIWAEGFADARGKFRADQLFEPNADGADMIIPEIAFRLRAPATLAPGEYPVRIFGKAAVDGRVVEAQTTLLIGPILDLWNFIRRPSPRITMTVYDQEAGGK